MPKQTAAPEELSFAMFEIITSYWRTQIVRAFADLSVPDRLAAGPLTAAQVAELADSDLSATYRLLRAGASLGLLSYEGEGRFANTALGEVLRADVPGSMRKMAMVHGAHAFWRCWEHLPTAVRTGAAQTDLALGMSVFDHLAKVPEEGALFSDASSESTRMVLADLVSLIDTEGVSVAVDVGGANGALVQALMQAQPTLRGIVLDRPNIVPGAAKAAVAAGLAERHSVVAGNFFESVPPGDLYLLKYILHDWDDEECRTILANCRAAASPGARAAVVEIVIGELGKPDFASLMDMNMLAMTTGQERDLAEHDALFEATGWRRVDAQRMTSGAPYSVLTLQAV